MGVVSLHWFRRGLRLHDNPALVASARGVDAVVDAPIVMRGRRNGKASVVVPLFCLDPEDRWQGSQEGQNRRRFLFESLADLDTQLRRFGSRLLVAQGNPRHVLPSLCDQWSVQRVTWEDDTEPYARSCAAEVMEKLEGREIEVYGTHTLHHPTTYLERRDAPRNFGTFKTLFEEVGPPRRPIDISWSADDFGRLPVTEEEFELPEIPPLREPELVFHRFPGGETEALDRLDREVVQRPSWVENFRKPQTRPNSVDPDTTVLSPYVTYGCLSVRRFWWTLDATAQPRLMQETLQGQLIWREFFHCCGYSIGASFGEMVGNPICRQIPWDDNPALLQRWATAQTGFPFIDALMTQLRTEGWIHHLGRHAVACFLTRGDLWQLWIEGAKVFEELLLDADWSLNNANWMWLSCSSFFYQYFRIYSPISYGKKTDPEGAYIRQYLPKLANFPTKYIFEPWTAPLEIQRACGCVIGRDYPEPIVDHKVASQSNMAKMKEAYKPPKRQRDAP